MVVAQKTLKNPLQETIPKKHKNATKRRRNPRRKTKRSTRKSQKNSCEKEIPKNPSGICGRSSDTRQTKFSEDTLGDNTTNGIHWEKEILRNWCVRARWKEYSYRHTLLQG